MAELAPRLLQARQVQLAAPSLQAVQCDDGASGPQRAQMQADASAHEARTAGDQGMVLTHTGVGVNIDNGRCTRRTGRLFST